MAFRTDLAMECCDTLKDSLPGGICRSSYTFDEICVETVEITEDEAAQALGKPKGKYITITTPHFASSRDVSDDEINKIAQEIRGLLPESGTVLVVGLGNDDITPDAIGPRTAHQILATRHIDKNAAMQAGLGELRPTAALVPGVLGQTGIESSQIVLALVKAIQPSAVIVVDALAARSVSRLGNTIQISNSGISPGSGVMNTRKELSRQTLGVPVISAGIPTVVDAATLIGDLLGGEPELDDSCFGMMVTPRDIDQLIGHACRTLALAMNRALQKELSFEVISYLMS